MKNFVLHGETRFQFRVEMYNVFNNVNYSNPNATFGDAQLRRRSPARTPCAAFSWEAS